MWKFWKRNEGSGAGGTGNPVKLKKPGDLPPGVGRSLVVDYKLNPDWVWKLKCVLRPVDNSKNESYFRVFSDASAREKAIRILNYDSLNDHPELILFSGSYDKAVHIARFDKKDNR